MCKAATCPHPRSRRRQRSLEPTTSPRQSPNRVNTNTQLDPQPRQLRRPGGPKWPCPGSTVPPSASSAMTPPPNPVEPSASAREAQRHHTDRSVLVAMATLKVAHLLNYDLVKTIAMQGQFCWCPGRLVWLLSADLQPGSGSIVQVNAPIFNL